MSEWKLKKIGKVAGLYQGLAINSKTKHLLVEDGPRLPLLRIKDLLENSEEFFVDHQNAPKKSLVDIGDLIFTRTGQVGYVFNNRKGVLHNNCFKIIPKDERVLSSDFLYHYFNRENVRDYLESISAGSVQPDMNHSIFKLVEIPVPPIEEQNAIASVLSCLDDKIDLLHRQNQTLEQMAETLFRQWFVEEADEGWEEVLLEDLIALKQGKYIKAEEISEAKSEEFKFPLYGGNGIRGYLNTYKYDSPKVAITCRGNGCGLVQLLDPFSTVSNSCIVFDNVETISTWFLYYYSKILDFASVTSGSAQPQITITDIGKLELTIPDKTSLEAFDNQVNIYHQKVLSNQTQIRTLTALRDTLLPKLMSGEVKVSEL